MVQGRLAPLRVLVPLVVLACGRSGSGNPAPPPRDATLVAPGDAAEAAAPLVLGMTQVQRFAYRSRGGQPAFRRARELEAAGDWPAVASACREALAADPDHLEAAYLLAVALAKSDAAPSAILAPLTTAVAGDFSKWGQAALEQPALQSVLATPAGTAWRGRVDEARRDLAAALARSLLVTASGDVFAHDREAARWYRLTRTWGAVVGTLHVPSVQKLAFVTRTRTAPGGPVTYAVGTVDLVTGRMRRPVPLATAAPIRVAYNHRGVDAFVVRIGKAWFAVDDHNGLSLRALAAKLRAGHVSNLTDMAWLEITGRTARLERLSLPNVHADWDEHTLASALKIGSSQRVVSVPTGLIDGTTATWSPDRTQLAFVAQLDDRCTPEMPTVAAYVADAATGKVDELARAQGGLSVEWLASRTLAIAGDRGVSIAEVPGGTPVVLDGADGLATPRRRARCAAAPAPSDEPVPIDDVTD